MDYKYINQLLDRYWNCETTLEEEEILRTFFSQDDIPAELSSYKSIFAYEQEETKSEALGEDFDQKMMSLIGNETADEPKKAKVISLTERLKPLFKAVAIVAIFLTLGNAAQVPFQDNAGYAGSVEMNRPTKGVSVASISDSTSVDSMQQSSIKVSEEPSSTILK